MCVFHWLFLDQTLDLIMDLVFIFFNFLFLKFILLYFSFLAALGLHCCARAFSSCGEWGLLFVAVRGLLFFFFKID